MQQVLRQRDTVIDAFAHFLNAQSTEPVRTPFGVALYPTPGRYAIGQIVSAPGVDECSRMELAEVLVVGTRDDYPGVWCLVRGARGISALSALVNERDLHAVSTGQNRRLTRYPVVS